MALAREKTREDVRLAGAGRYELRGVVGGGRTGIVHRAYDRELGRTVALKTLRTFDADALYRLKREFRTLAGLAHPNLVSFFDLFVEGDERFFTMELVDGVEFVEAFRQRIEAPGADAGAVHRDLRSAIVQLTAGLEALHRQGVLHRDVKPANVLVTGDGQVVLLDFGLASDVVALDDDLHAVAGTMGYLAPEQISGRGACLASDWFSAGVMLYETLTGRLPFDGEALRELLSGRACRPASPRGFDRRTPPDLEALVLALLDPDPGRRPIGEEVLARLAPAHETPAHAVVEPAAQPPRVRLVGRDAELSALRETLQRSRAGLHAIEIVGPSGIGKTALVAKLAVRAVREHGALVLSARCHPQEAIPFKAVDGVIDELARHLASLTDEAITPLLPDDVAAARRLFPVLGRVSRIARAPVGPGPELDPSLGRRQAFGALRELLARVAARRPLVVSIDDFQWGDLDSLALLRELCRQPDPPAMLLLLASRSDAAHKSPVLQALRAAGSGLVEPARQQTLALEPLQRDDATRLVRDLLGEDGVGSDVERIVVESQCSPFLAAELARHRAESRRRGATTEAYEPPDVGALVAARVQALPPLAREVLELLAVAGRPLDRELTRHAERAGVDLRPALGLLCSQSLACTLPAGERVASAAYHDRIREAVLAMLPAEVLRERHRALASALACESDADPRLLVDHYEGAGDVARAGELALASGRRAAADLAFNQAAELYARARDLGTSTVPRWMLEARIGQMLTHAGRAREAAEQYESAASALFAVHPVDTRRITLRRRAAELYLRSGLYPEGLRALRASLDEAGVRYAETPVGALGSVLMNRQRLRLRRRLARAGQPRPLGIAAADRERLEVYWSAGVGLSLFDMVRAADFQLRHALLAFRLGEPRHLARALATEALTLAWEGGARNVRRSERVQADAVRLASAVGDPRIEVQTLVMRAAIAFVEHRFREGLALCERGARICNSRHVGTTWEIANLELCSVSTLSLLGEMARMRARTIDLLQRADERGDLYSSVSLRIGLPNLCWLASDDPDDARRQVAQARAAASLAPFQDYCAVYAETQIDLYAGDPAAGWERINAAWPGLRRNFVLRIQGVRIDLLDLRARCALALLADGRAPRRGRGRLMRVVRLAAWRLEHERVAWTPPMTAALRAGLAWQNGDRAAAIALLVDAAAGFDRMDMRAHAGAARLHLAGTGVGESVDRCADALRALGIADPAAYAAMLLPGMGGSAARP